MTKSDAMWIGYWAMRQSIEDELVHWLRCLVRGVPDAVYWENHIEERIDAAMIFYSEYRRLNRPPKRRRKAA
jgi:hypothetical protein